MSFNRAPLPLNELLEDAGSAALREINHMLPMWFWETDANYVITYCSENIARLTNVTAEELVGVCILNPLYGRGESEAGLAEYQDLLRRRQPIESYSYERILLSGDTAVLLDSAIPSFDSDGKFTGYCGISFHLSEALRAADANGSLMGSLKNRADQLERALSQRNADLAASNRLMGEVLDALGEGLLVTSQSDLTAPDNEIMFVNSAYRNLLGLDEHEVYSGMPLGDIARTLSQRGETVQTALSEAAHKIEEGDVVELTMPTIGTSIEIKGIPRPAGGMVLVHTDVTALRAQMAMQEEATRLAEAANSAKSAFLAAMSHEIRTPMNGIVGVADLLHETTLDREQQEYVETIRSSAVALTSLITDILDYSKIEAGHLALQEAEFDLHGLMEDMRKMLSPLAQGKGIDLLVDIAPDQPRCVIGDQQRLRQVMINLMGNAIKFTLTGSVLVLVEPSNDGGTRIEVRDTGIGIPQNKLAGIFNSFEQVQSGFHREFEGTGLGLAISRKLVRAMGGDISVSSADGAGSVFRFTMPIRPADRPEKSRLMEVTPEPRALDLSHARILLAEDNRTNQLVVKKMLKRCSAVPDIVENGQDACIAFEQNHYDIVLMDVSMPIMSGLEATTRIRRFEHDHDRAPCPIIALTGNAFDSDRENCVAAGMTGFMTKPIRLHELVACLEEALLA